MEALESAIQPAFGTDVMKRLKVCPRCGRMASAKQHVCPECGGRLPQSNLFQLYQKRHRLCPVCDTALSDSMRFCPHCGAKTSTNAFLNEKGRK